MPFCICCGINKNVFSSAEQWWVDEKQMCRACAMTEKLLEEALAAIQKDAQPSSAPPS